MRTRRKISLYVHRVSCLFRGRNYCIWDLPSYLALEDMESKLVSRQSKRHVMPEENNDFVVDIDEEKKQRKLKGILHLLKANSMEFCRSTSLHGLQYIGEKQRHVLER